MILEKIEMLNRKDAIKKLVAKGYTKKEATNIYETWRYNYVRGIDLSAKKTKTSL